MADTLQFDLFLSFSTRDRRQSWFGTSVDVVSELKTALERYRHPDTHRRLRVCTYDEDFELRAEVREAIARNVEQSAAFLFLSTRNAASSDFVRFEVNHAAKIHVGARLLTALVDMEPSASFPSVFVVDTHAADLSTSGCADRAAWRRRVELEAAKIAARIWDVPLQRVRDRFAIARRRQRMLRYGGIGISLLAIGITAAVGMSQYRKREAARVFAAHQQYAADMATVQRDWTEGHVDKVRATLERHRGNVNPDPRSFEWYTYWRVSTAEHLALGKFAEAVTGLAISPRAPWLAFSAESQPIRIIKIGDGTAVRTLSGATSGARSLAFTRDGAGLMAIVESGVVLWDAHNEKESMVPGQGPEKLISLACHPQRTQCVVANEAGTLYEVAQGRLRAAKTSFFRAAQSARLAFSPNGQFLVAVDDAGTVHVVDASNYSLRHVKTLQDLRSEQGFAVSDEQAIVATGDHVTIIDLRTGDTQTSPRLVNGRAIAGVAIDSGRNLLATGDPSDQSVVIWGMEDWRRLGAVKGYRGWLNVIHFVPNTSYLAASSLGGDIKVWDLTRIGSRTVREQPGTIRSIVFLPESRDVVTLDSYGWVRCWSTETLEERWKRRLAEEMHWDFGSLRGQHVAVAHDGTIRVLDPKDGNEIDTFPGYGPLTSSADGTVFAYIHAVDDAVVVEEVATGAKASFPIRKPASGELDITSIVLTPDGRSLLAATADGRVIHFDVETRESRFELQGHTRVIYAMSVSPDGRLFATGSSDQLVGLWEVVTGRNIAKLEGHTATVQALAFTPDGKTLASGDQEGRIRFWNLHARLPTITFGAHRVDLHPGVAALTFSTGGNLLVSGGSLGTILLWDADAQN
jgi:WD40 repeat protein